MPTEFERTPDEAFAGLPDFPFEPNYLEIDGLRLAHIDEGSGEPVVFLHGEPAWSFLWRKVIGPVRDAGFRCIAPDLAGFGRSDKPTDLNWYSFVGHVDRTEKVFDALKLRDVTLVVHDWGGGIGFQLAARRPDLVKQLVIMDTGLFNGKQGSTEAWRKFRDFVERTEDLPVGMLVRGGCGTDPGDEITAAYNAPFPTPASKAGTRSFPLMLPVTPDVPGAAEGLAAATALAADARPRLVIWADSDPIVPLKGGEIMAEQLGNGTIDHIIEGAGHFLQEDAGEQIGSLIADWLLSNPIPRTHRGS
jgi:haloalkane dehalogenase